MGGGRYSLDIAQRTRANDNSAFQSSAAPAAREVHAALNPFGKTREVNNVTPIIVALDVTRSRGDDTKLMYEKLPQLMGQIELKGYIDNPGISFCAIGDATTDRAPLQVSQFEGDNRLDEALGRFWIEEGGGGTGQESYELAAYFYSRTNCVRLAQGVGKKGYCFFVGDEGFYSSIDKATIRRVIGDEVSDDVPAAEAFRRLQEKFHAFFIYPQKTMDERRANIDAEIRDRVRKAGGQYDGVDVRASLLWNNGNDLDLHVTTPRGEHIFYGAKQASCGGWLDVDMNAGGAQTTKPVENVRWGKGAALAGRYKVWVRNFAFHESKREPTAWKVELEVGGKITHHEGVISPNGQTGDASDMVVAEFDYDPNAQLVSTKPGVDQYAGYADDVILAQWATVLPKEHIIRVGDPKSIIDVLLGALAIADGKVDLDTYLRDMRELGASEERVHAIDAALAGLPSAKNVATATVTGDVPSHAGGGKKTTMRL
ncbi:MAG: hypothetical protein M4D80_18505 [Myxococcota bacterium]|nr:hypothetical protein [Deltaproteobacteria bacterium]MDQ3337158.1 hypothetical protein [Myxococcota bacterium]